MWLPETAEEIAEMVAENRWFFDLYKRLRPMNKPEPWSDLSGWQFYLERQPFGAPLPVGNAHERLKVAVKELLEAKSQEDVQSALFVLRIEMACA